MLPEILDSRHNRHMPIRNPRYIIEAKEAAAKKTNNGKSIRQNAIESENVTEQKQFKCDISLTETAITAAVADLNMEQDDDCVIVSYTSNKR